MPTPTQTRKILIKIDTGDSKGLNEIAQKMGYLNKNTQSLAKSMSYLTSIVTGFIGYLGVREITRMADEMQNLSNRLTITAQAGEQTSETLAKIANLADRTNQSISSVGEVYNRLAISLSKINPRSDELISLSEVLIDTFRVSGATIGETSNTIIQLSQAFQSGELRGQELRSVMEQNGVLAKILNKEFGSDVYKKAEKGQIRVVDVLKLLAKEQENIINQAKVLAPTFEQTLTKSMNKVAVQIDELNKKFQLSSKFATIMSVAVENLGSILVVFGGILSVIAISYIPKLINSIQLLRAAMIALSVSNPILLTLTAIITLAGLIYANFDKLTVVFKKFQANAYDFAASIEDVLNKVRDSISGSDSEIAKRGRANADALRKTAASIREEVKALEASQNQQETPRDPGKDIQSVIDKLNKIDKPKDKLRKVKEILGDINKELASGAISVEEYNKKLVSFELYKLNREFAEGKFDVFTYNQRLRELNVQELNRQLKLGLITINQFQDAVKKSSVEELTAKFEAGKISLIEYNQELIKISDQFLPGSALQAGTASYLQSIGTLSDNIAKGITATFGHLEDNLVEFVKTGEFNFKKLTEAILDDLTRIIIRASIIRPLANAILGGFGGAGAAAGASAGTSGDFSGVAAKGMAFDRGVRKFASGGIVDSPTMFRYGSGQRGLMGEAGSEAIIPLQRSRNGDLGVAASVTPVTVNVINNSGASVEQRESTGPNGEKTIDILVLNKVRDGIITGKFDGAMKQSFGVNRKGS